MIKEVINYFKIYFKISNKIIPKNVVLFKESVIYKHIKNLNLKIFLIFSLLFFIEIILLFLYGEKLKFILEIEPFLLHAFLFIFTFTLVIIFPLLFFTYLFKLVSIKSNLSICILLTNKNFEKNLKFLIKDYKNYLHKKESFGEKFFILNEEEIFQKDKILTLYKGEVEGEESIIIETEFNFKREFITKDFSIKKLKNYLQKTSIK